MQAGRMAVARHGGWPTIGAAERMQIETQELDELMRGADGVTGDVRDALYEAVGVRAPHPVCAVGALCTKGRQNKGVRQRWQMERRQVSSTGQFKNIDNNEKK